MEEEQSYHYFASSFGVWNAHESLWYCLNIHRKSVRPYFDRFGKDSYKWFQVAVYKVPLPVSAHYHIDHHRPEVEGVEFIDKVLFRKNGKHKNGDWNIKS